MADHGIRASNPATRLKGAMFAITGTSQGRQHSRPRMWRSPASGRSRSSGAAFPTACPPPLSCLGDRDRGQPVDNAPRQIGTRRVSAKPVRSTHRAGALSTPCPRRRSPRKQRRGGQGVDNATRHRFETGDVPTSAPDLPMAGRGIRAGNPATRFKGAMFAIPETRRRGSRSCADMGTPRDGCRPGHPRRSARAGSRPSPFPKAPAAATRHWFETGDVPRAAGGDAAVGGGLADVRRERHRVRRVNPLRGSSATLRPFG